MQGSVARLLQRGFDSTPGLLRGFSLGEREGKRSAVSSLLGSKTAKPRLQTYFFAFRGRKSHLVLKFFRYFYATYLGSGWRVVLLEPVEAWDVYKLVCVQCFRSRQQKCSSVRPLYFQKPRRSLLTKSALKWIHEVLTPTAYSCSLVNNTESMRVSLKRH